MSARLWLLAISALSVHASLLLAREMDAKTEPRPSKGTGGKTGVFKDEKIEVKKLERSYRLVVPETIDPRTSAPLVFAFHGLGDSSGLMSWYTQLDRVAEKHKFILIYPNGRAKMWPLLPILAQDDLQFFDELYSLASTNYNIDLNRVYVLGMSNGGFFCHLLARERPDKIAAIASHSAGLGAMNRDPRLKQKFAVIIIHGDDDSIVKVAESRKANEAYQKWGHPVEYVEVKGLNHFWAHKANINEKVWTFFVAHPLKYELHAGNNKR